MTVRHSPPQFDGTPFHLDESAQTWVRSTWRSLTVDEKISQVLVELCVDPADSGELDRLLSRGVGGIFRPFHARPDALEYSAAYVQDHARIPTLLAGDLEFAEHASAGVPGWTPYPNQLAVAATGDQAWAERMGTVGATEGRRLGFHWSFTPVVDVALNPGNPVVSTRSFGSDVSTIRRMMTAYITGLQAGGLAASAKHWPGDGIDARDQHLVTSVNSLDMHQWRATYGRIFKDAIDLGVKTIMAGHISLPAYFTDEDRRSGRAWKPATLSRELTTTLLREELGFQGLVVSDATEMAGFGSQGRRDELIPLCLASGCDMLLFTRPQDAVHVRAGLAAGVVTMDRLDEAVLRVLALKASLGLHLPAGRSSGRDAAIDWTRHQGWAEECAAAAVTVVKDESEAVPLSAAASPRLAVITESGRSNALRRLTELIVPDLLRAEGFQVTMYPPGHDVAVTEHDALLYIVADEANPVGNLRVDWTSLQGRFPHSMARYWHDLPTIFVALGHPYHLYDAPQCPTFINAYSPAEPVQRAVVNVLVGRAKARGVSPIDPFAGLGPGEAGRPARTST